MKKRVLIIIVLMCLCFSIIGCGTEDKTDEHDEMIKKAVEAVIDAWQEEYAKDRYTGTDSTVQIKNTRLLILKENTDPYYQEIAFVVDFVIFSDMYGTAPYYIDAGYLNNVVVYKDGTMEVTNNYVLQVARRTYNFDLSNILDEVKDYNDLYNVDRKLK